MMENIQNNKKWLYGMTLSQLEKVVVAKNFKRFVARQIADWLYKKHVKDISSMRNLSKVVKDELEKDYIVGEICYSEVQSSKDGTRKYLFPTLKGDAIESAYIPEKERATLCVSSQAGCRNGCKFCMTGRQGFQHNLTSGEILNQIRNIEEYDKLSNVVYMGMGEPMDNIDNVLDSIEILTSSWGYGWSPTRITVSTIGIIPALKRYLEECKAHLTISLHSAVPELRKQIMPVENKYSIVDVLDLLKHYDFIHQRRLSFAYTLFGGLNDSLNDAEKLRKLLLDFKMCRVNLIPFHQIPDSDLKPSPKETMIRFKDYLTHKGIITTIRTSRGEDIDAACGLLSTNKSEK